MIDRLTGMSEGVQIFALCFVTLALLATPVLAGVLTGVTRGGAQATIAATVIDLPGAGILKDSNYLLHPYFLATQMGIGVLGNSV